MRHDRHYSTEHNEHFGIAEINRTVATSQPADEIGIFLHSLELCLIRFWHECQGDTDQPTDLGLLRHGCLVHVTIDLGGVMAGNKETVESAVNSRIHS